MSHRAELRYKHFIVTFYLLNYTPKLFLCCPLWPSSAASNANANKTLPLPAIEMSPPDASNHHDAATSDDEYNSHTPEEDPEEQTPQLPDGYTSKADEFEKEQFMVAPNQYMEHRGARQFGTANPSIMHAPYWKHMIHSFIRGKTCITANAYYARKEFDNTDVTRTDLTAPVWCFQRYGQSRTLLPDGRVVYIGGEHEDFYDPDFCIYNDVVVIAATSPDERPKRLTLDCVMIYGYPKAVFPPTDFHSATYYKDTSTGKEVIYNIGCLGYGETQSRKYTEVYRLDLKDFSIERMDTSGDGPKESIWEHEARLLNDDTDMIRVSKDGEHWTLRLCDMTWI